MSVSTKVQPINTKILANQIKTQGYTAHMGVPPKVQPINATVLTNNIENFGLHCTHGCVN